MTKTLTPTFQVEHITPDFAENVLETKNSNKEITINSSQSVTLTSKDAQGQPATYRTNVIVTLLIKDQGKVLKTKSFNEDFTYNNIENKFLVENYHDLDLKRKSSFEDCKVF